MPEGMLLPPAAAQPAKLAASPAPDAAASSVPEAEGQESFQQVLQSELSKPETHADANAAAAEPADATAQAVPVPDVATLLGLTGRADATASFVALRTVTRPDESVSSSVRDGAPLLADTMTGPDADEPSPTSRRLVSLTGATASRPDVPVGRMDEPGTFGALLGAIVQGQDDRKPLRVAVSGEVEPVTTKVTAPLAMTDVAAVNASAQGPTRAAEAAKPVITVPVGAPGWGEALADRVTVMAQGRQSTAELQLNPPNLGPVEIKLSLQGDQASVSFHSAHAPVREAIQASMPRLSEAFAEAGIGLGSVFVGADARSNDRQTPDQQERGASRGRESGGLTEVRGAGEVLWNGPLAGLRAVDLFA